MDLNKAELIQKDVETLLSVLCTKYNVRVSYDGGKYSGKSYMPKIVFDDVENISIDMENTIKSQKLGYDFNIIGKKINYLGVICEVIDIRTKNRKYPIIIKDFNINKEYKIEIVDSSMFV